MAHSPRVDSVCQEHIVVLRREGHGEQLEKSGVWHMTEKHYVNNLVPQILGRSLEQSPRILENKSSASVNQTIPVEMDIGHSLFHE